MTREPDLFTLPRPAPSKAFDGKTYQPERDHDRLTGQLERVFNLMRDGRWRTIPAIAYEVRGSESSVSARLRDFRKAKYGGHTVQRERVRKGLYMYRVIVRKAVAA
jgi:hypothetical protein